MRTHIRRALAVFLLVAGSGCSLTERNPVLDATTPLQPTQFARPVTVARGHLRETALSRTVEDTADPGRSTPRTGTTRGRRGRLSRRLLLRVNRPSATLLARLDEPSGTPRPKALLRAAPGFDDAVRLTEFAPEAPDDAEPSSSMADDEDDGGDEEEDEEAKPPTRVVRPLGFPDGVQLSQELDDSPRFGRTRRGRAVVLDFSEDGEEEDQQDTNLDRPRAERRGGGGGPTRIKEEEDERPETEEEEFKSDLLIKLLGMEDSDISIFGWLQGSFTGNPARPRNGINFGVNPNLHANTFQFEQLYFVVEKLPKLDDDVDFGFRVDNLFGTDWPQFHMNGLFDNVFPINGFGWDPIQFYGEVHLPILSDGGIDIKGGRFYALPGYESGQAPARPLPSGSYLFGYSHPFTHFGVMSIWHATDQLNLYNGVVNGWDRWIDQNYRWGYSGAVSWDSKDDRTNLTVTYNVGPNQFPRFFAANYQLAPNGVPNPPFLARRRNLSYGSNNALLFTTVLIHEWTEKFTLIGETDQGFEMNIPGLGPSGTTQNAAWYGLAGWFLYQFTEKITGVYRAEVFRDNNGARTGFDTTYYEMTLGGIYKPRSWFWLRPEIRWDWTPGTRVYDDGQSRHQFTVGFDAIFLF